MKRNSKKKIDIKQLKQFFSKKKKYYDVFEK